MKCILYFLKIHWVLLMLIVADLAISLACYLRVHQVLWHRGISLLSCSLLPFWCGLAHALILSQLFCASQLVPMLRRRYLASSSFLKFQLLLVSLQCIYLMFNLMSCQSLSSFSLIQIPCMHILFSLASASKDIIVQQMNSPDGHPLSLVTLCSYSTSILLQFCQCQAALYIGLKTLKQLMKAKDAVAPQSAPGPMMAIDERFDDSGKDSDVDSII